MLSNRIKRLVRDEINARVFLATHGYERRRHSDSYYSMSTYAKAKIRRLADRAIRIHDARYNDLVGFVLFKALFINLALPFLINLAKNAISNGISASIKQKLIDPILDRLISAGTALVRKGDEDTYTDAIIRNIKTNFGRLIDILKREGSAIAGKASFIFNKIKNIV